MKKIFIFFFVLVLIIAIGGFVYLNRNSFNNDSNPQAKQIDFNIEITSQERKVYNPTTEISVSSEKKITLKEGARASLNELGEKNGKFYYSLKLTGIMTGSSKRKVIFADESDVIKEIEFTLNRETVYYPIGYESIEGWPDSKLVIDPYDPLVRVDKKNRLPEDFEPKDLVDLNATFGIYTFNDAKLNREAAQQLKRLWDDCAKATGDYVTVASGYRSWAEQQKIYGNNVGLYGEDETNTFSAKPGHSEHQLGLTVDFTNKETDYKLDEKFSSTKAGKWIADNAHLYGFVESYSKGSSLEINYQYEPWHYRYIGKTLALEFKQSGKIFQDWINEL